MKENKEPKIWIDEACKVPETIYKAIAALIKAKQ